MRRLLVPALVLVACSDTPEGSVNITTGEEGDALSRAPAPVLLVAESLALDGSRRELARTALPAESLSLGELPRSDVGAIAVTALDDSGKTLLRGETLFVQWGALESRALEVFVQRTGELARMPRGPGAFEPEVATMAVGRYVVLAAGTATVLYDLLNLRTLEGAPTLPRAARSFATFDVTALVIDEEGASAFDLQTRSASDVASPAGATFAEVAGGATVAAPDGTQYVVGGTRRSGGATSRVLRLASDGKLTAASLAHAREGACATWVEGRGLVVLGGSDDAPGAEILAPSATQGAPLALPPIAARGCAASTLDASHVLLAHAIAAVVDLACAADCKAAPWPGALDLVRAQAFTLAPDAALVVGDDASGATRAFRASAAGAREVLLRTPRRGARLVPLPQAGAAAIAGGGPGVEQYLE